MTKLVRHMKTILVAIVSLFSATVSFAESCGTLKTIYGPFDFTNPDHVRTKLPRVESHHFTPEVERLVHGTTDTYIIGDLDKTLKAFPNHHRALWSVSRLQRKPEYKHDTRYYTADCYFKRAINFIPTDRVVYLIYGMHLQAVGDYQNAEAQYKYALKLSPSYADAHYNLGLLYMDINKIDKARSHALTAYQYGHPLQGLKRRLTRVNAW